MSRSHAGYIALTSTPVMPQPPHEWCARHQSDGAERLDQANGQARRRDHGHRNQFTDGQKTVRLEKVVLADGKEIWRARLKSTPGAASTGRSPGN